MLELRIFEEKVALEYPNGKMRTPTHLGIGQEAVAVGVLSQRKQSDVVFSHHRCHNHFLASGGSRYELFAELLGKRDGCSGGRGGSVHLVDRKVNFLGTSPILTEAVTFATGAAFAFKIREEPRAAIVFFGDAAFEEGAMWESFNFAAINNLPVLYICENNLYSTESHLSKRVATNTSFIAKARAFGLSASNCDGNNVEDVAEHSAKALDKIYYGAGPYLLECNTYRTKEHVGPGFDFDFGRTYRSEEEIRRWMSKCPIATTKRILLDVYGVSVESFERTEQDIISNINKEFKLADSSEFPAPESYYKHLYNQVGAN
jgi:pyruvate dehydrogenase E1 component alpha subunit